MAYCLSSLFLVLNLPVSYVRKYNVKKEWKKAYVEPLPMDRNHPKVEKVNGSPYDPI